MKKHFLPFLAALALPIACTVTEEPEIADEPAARETTHLVISANSSAMTKAVLNEDRSVSFVETDALSVFDSEYQNCIFTVKELYPDGSADFEGDVASTEGPMPVMYPYQEDARLEKYGPAVKLYFEIPSEQHAVENSFDPAAAFSFGMAEYQEGGIVGTTLSNGCALVKFTMPEGSYSKVTLSVSKGSLCGECFVSVTSDGLSDINPMGVGNTVTLSGEIAGKKTYFMSVLPGIAENGIDVKIYDANGDLAGEKSTDKKVTFTKGCILNIGALPTAEESEDWLGEGTEASPYIIATPAHLKKLEAKFHKRESARPYAGKYFKQIRDIDMDGEAITIGNYADRYQDTDWSEPTAFNAHYDGGGHTISNYRLTFIYYDLNAHHQAGLFNYLCDATISNLNLKPAVLEGDYLIDGIDTLTDHYYIGLLAGETDGACTISNCNVLPGNYKIYARDTGAGIDSSQTVAFGGLVGRTTCDSYENIIFKNCINEANLTLEGGRRKAIAGGLIGTNYGCGHYEYIDRCRNKGNISVISDYTGDIPLEVFAGGIIGRITDDGNDVVFRISNCVNEGAIYAKSNMPKYSCAGGIAGSNDSDGWFDFHSEDPWVYNCLNKGDIYAECLVGLWGLGYDACAGGIFGYCYDDDTHLALCANVGQISAKGPDPCRIGPICGTKNGDHLWCYWLRTDEFWDYVPNECTNCRACIGFILGSGPGTTSPEYVRMNGNAGDDADMDVHLFGKPDNGKTEWSQAQWAAAASWTGKSDLNWDLPDHENNLDLDF